MHSKMLAYRKSRKNGIIKGGRKSVKISSIRHDIHGLKVPNWIQRPIYIQDNPSKDFYFPISVDDAKQIMSIFRPEITETITHVWFRKCSWKEFNSREKPFGLYATGSGVRAIIIYAWPKDLTIKLGKSKPSNKYIAFYRQWNPRLYWGNKRWNLEFTPESIVNFYKHTLLHEIGHHIDNRPFSKANVKQSEDFANHFARQVTGHIKSISGENNAY